MTDTEKIVERLGELDDWRGELMKKLRKLINDSQPELTETWKWDTPVWKRKGLVCAISAFTGHVKMNFFKGASLADPDNLFNSGLDSKDHRSINWGEHDKLDAKKLQALLVEAVVSDK